MFPFSCHSFACESALKTTGFLQFGFAFAFYFSMLFSFGLSKWFNIRNMRWWKDSNSIPLACIQRSHTSVVAHIWCVFISIYLNLITFNLFFFDLTSSEVNIDTHPPPLFWSNFDYNLIGLAKIRERERFYFRLLENERG